MNSNDEHTDFANWLFGISKKKAREVNHIMDYASRFLGSKHRVIGHGLKTATVETKDDIIKITKFQPDLFELYLITGFDAEKLLAFYAHAIGDNITKPKVEVYGKKGKKSK